MAEPYEHVNYDFGAADRLSWALSMAHEKINALVALRKSQRTSLLGEPTSDNWSGAKRNDFETKFRSEQAALAAEAAEMLRLKAAVDHATAEAHAVNAHAH
jgi:hypothetical protein